MPKKKAASAAKKAAPKQTLATQLRSAIVDRDITHYQLGKDAGLSPAVIDRFISGERDVMLETAARLASALGLRLVETEKRKRSGK